VAEVRRRRGWTQQQLADKLAEIGYPMERTAILRLEKGKRADVRLSDVFAFALALDTWPINLIVPREDEAPVQVGGRVVTAPAARAWIRGQGLLRGMNPVAAFAELPESEQRRGLASASSRGMTPLQAGLMQERIAEHVEQTIEALREWPDDIEEE
jgi:transcriptional regulator with XRE-family HTH domain